MGVIIDKDWKTFALQNTDTINADTINEIDEKYVEDYSENGFFDKVKGSFKKVGIKVIYEALQLYYVTQRPDCPKKVKIAIFGVLGYFIAPIDFIPDFIPITGFTDDGGTIALALVWAHFLIDENVKSKAKDRIRRIFGDDAVAKLD